jgi:hypothetical protein
MLLNYNNLTHRHNHPIKVG